MFNTLRSYKDDFVSLPDPIKMFISAALFILLAFSIYSGVKMFIQEVQIRKIEAENRTLIHQSEENIDKAKKAEARADAAAERVSSLEEKISDLETKEKQTDEKIKTSQNNSNNLRNDLLRVRTSQPANIGTIELERRLCQRYPENCQ